MGIVKRIIIFLLIVGAANYGLYYIFTAVGAAPRDIMPISMWFNAVAVFIVVLPPVAGTLFGTGGAVTGTNMNKSRKVFDAANKVRKTVTYI